MSERKPIYKLIADPGCNSEQRARYENEAEEMNWALTKIGEALGWGNNPRWDLLFDAGLKEILKGAK